MLQSPVVGSNSPHPSLPVLQVPAERQIPNELMPIIDRVMRERGQPTETKPINMGEAEVRDRYAAAASQLPQDPLAAMGLARQALELSAVADVTAARIANARNQRSTLQHQREVITGKRPPGPMPSALLASAQPQPQPPSYEETLGGVNTYAARAVALQQQAIDLSRQGNKQGAREVTRQALQAYVQAATLAKQGVKQFCAFPAMLSTLEALNSKWQGEGDKLKALLEATEARDRAAASASAPVPSFGTTSVPGSGGAVSS